MSFQSLRELQSFVRSLDVPDERREVVEAELLDHFFARIGDGASEAEALSAFGSQDALRIRFEPVERGFSFRRVEGLGEGLRLAGAVSGAALLALALRQAAVGLVAGTIGLQAWPDDLLHRGLYLLMFDGAVQMGLRLALTVIGLALLVRRLPRARRCEPETGALALRALLASTLTLASPLVLEPLLGRAFLGLFTLSIGPTSEDQMLGLALWAATTVLVLVSPPWPRSVRGRRRSHG